MQPDNQTLIVEALKEEHRSWSDAWHEAGIRLQDAKVAFARAKAEIAKAEADVVETELQKTRAGERYRKGEDDLRVAAVRAIGR